MPVASQHDPRIELCGKIETLAALEAADGETVVPRETVRSACALVGGLPKGTRLPQASVSPDGEIGLTWFRGRDQLHAFIEPDGRLVWTEAHDGKVTPGDDIDSLTERPRFYSAIAHFYQ
jgi:hypothetical protein